ncbi:hypothetical protein ABZP36_030804 [Zizania latifolia]
MKENSEQKQRRQRYIDSYHSFRHARRTRENQRKKERKKERQEMFESTGEHRKKSFYIPFQHSKQKKEQSFTVLHTGLHLCYYVVASWHGMAWHGMACISRPRK